MAFDHTFFNPHLGKPNSKINLPYGNNIPVSKSYSGSYNANQVRSMALKMPSVFVGWGYDIEGRPVPNEFYSNQPDGNIGVNNTGYLFITNSGQNYSGIGFSTVTGKVLAPSGGVVPESHYVAGPLDVRFDYRTGMWTTDHSFYARILGRSETVFRITGQLIDTVNMGMVQRKPSFFPDIYQWEEVGINKYGQVIEVPYPSSGYGSKNKLYYKTLPVTLENDPETLSARSNSDFSIFSGDIVRVKAFRSFSGIDTTKYEPGIVYSADSDLPFFSFLRTSFTSRTSVEHSIPGSQNRNSYNFPIIVRNTQNSAYLRSNMGIGETYPSHGDNRLDRRVSLSEFNNKKRDFTNKISSIGYGQGNIDSYADMSFTLKTEFPSIDNVKVFEFFDNTKKDFEKVAVFDRVVESPSVSNAFSNTACCLRAQPTDNAFGDGVGNCANLMTDDCFSLGGNPVGDVLCEELQFPCADLTQIGGCCVQFDSASGGLHFCTIVANSAECQNFISSVPGVIGGGFLGANTFCFPGSVDGPCIPWNPAVDESGACCSEGWYINGGPDCGGGPLSSPITFNNCHIALNSYTCVLNDISGPCQSVSSTFFGIGTFCAQPDGSGGFGGQTEGCNPQPNPPPLERGACCVELISSTYPNDSIGDINCSIRKPPSLVPGGNPNCTPQSGNTCLEQYCEDYCITFGAGYTSCYSTQWHGLNTVCDESIDCGGNGGACCGSETSCYDSTSMGCFNTGGVFLGRGTVCGEVNDCMISVYGACCLQGIECNEATHNACYIMGGEYFGNGSKCKDINCGIDETNPIPQIEGACCTSLGVCFSTTEVNCIQSGHSYVGDFTTCGTNIDCSNDLGACCDISNNCIQSNFSDCIDVNIHKGIFLGIGSNCLGVNCNDFSIGACCFSDGSCSELIEIDCVLAEGVYQGISSLCNTSNCGAPPPPPPPSNGACCNPIGSCVEETQQSCIQSGGSYSGDGTVCQNIDCSLDTGACCDLGTCSLTTFSNCNGNFFGIGTNCVGIDCNNVFTGPCCFTDSSCSEVTSIECINAGGSYFGDNLTCLDISCAVEVDGACCSSIGDCSMQTPSSCISSGGTFLGEGLLCSQINCNAYIVGACCFSDGSCFDVTESTCSILNGFYKGHFTVCAAENCQVILDGACCNQDNTCSIQSSVACITGGGMYQGDGSVCSPGGCDLFGSCCLLNPDGSSSCQILTSATCILAGGLWAGGNPCNQVDCNIIIPGACCLTDLSCLDNLIENTCVSVLGGIFQGINTDCATIGSCPTSGACCFPTGYCRQALSFESCNSAGGVFQGIGTTCANSNCPITVPTGACCLLFSIDPILIPLPPDSAINCFVTSEFLCKARDGRYLGDNIACPLKCDFFDHPPIPCAGACCVPGIGCVLGMTEIDCFSPEVGGTSWDCTPFCNGCIV